MIKNSTNTNNQKSLKKSNNQMNFIFSMVLISILIGCKKENITFKNLDFENTCQTEESGFCNWEVSYKVSSNIIPFKDVKSGNTLLMIDNEDGVGFIEQTYELSETLEDYIFTLSGKIKTKNLKGKGAGLNITILDEEENMLESVDMGYGDFNYVKGTADWQAKNIKTILTNKEKKIKIGLISYGSGTAYFDNITVNFKPITGQKPNDLAKEYIDKAADSIMKNSLYRDRINIKPIKKKAYAIAGNAKTPEEIYLAIEYMLQSINDNHVFFATAKARKEWKGNNDEKEVDLSSIKYSTAKVKEGFGYISVPGFHNNDATLRLSFADTIRKQIQNLYKKKVKGFIVDLRENDGGNMEPMLAGLEPFYSADTTGFLIDINKNKEFWGRNDAFKKELGSDYTQPKIPVKIIENLPIAVLYGSKTGSSGEVIIISFIGNANTQSFGQPSYGLTTGNGEFELPDGSCMFLSSTYMADRSGKIYKEKVIPDVVIDENDKSKDKTLEAAIKWLQNK